MLEAFVKDLKHSLRMFRQSPAFTLAAVAAMTLGIGANTAIFSVVNAVLLKPVSFPEPERLVMFMNTSPQGSGPAASPAKTQHYREQDPVVEQVTAFRTGIVNHTGGTFPEQLRMGQVSVHFFKLFGAPIIRGREFTAAEDVPGAERVVVLGQRFWETRLNRSEDVVGPTPHVWLPFQLPMNSPDQGHYFQAAGRLKAGVSLEQAQTKLRASADDYRRKYPNAIGPNNSFTVQPIREVLVRNVRTSLLVL